MVQLWKIIIPASQVSADVHFPLCTFGSLFERPNASHPPECKKKKRENEGGVVQASSSKTQCEEILPIILSGTTARDNNVQEDFNDFVNDCSGFDFAYCIPKAYLTNHPRIHGEIL